MLEPIDRGIQAPLLNLEQRLRELLDPEQNAVAVHWPEGEGFEDEQVEGALEQLSRLGRVRVFARGGHFADP